MARDGVFFPAAAQVHPKFKTPHVSIVAQALWTSLLILTGSLDTLSNYVGFAITLFAGIAVTCRVRAARARATRATAVQDAGLSHCAGDLRLRQPGHRLNAFYRSPGPSALGLLVIASGIPLYLWLTRRLLVSWDSSCNASM